MAIIQHIAFVAKKQLGRDFFTDKLSWLCIGWLGDDVSMIRNAAAQNLKELIALFGTSFGLVITYCPLLRTFNITLHIFRSGLC